MNDSKGKRAAGRRRRGAWTNAAGRAMYGRGRAAQEHGVASSGTARIFVYGTLLRGEPNHALLAGARLLGAALTAPRFELVSLGPYPAMVPSGETTVTGEVYEVDEGTLADLDRLEGCPGLYQRERVQLEDGGEVLAYLMEPERVLGRPRIPGGDWRERPRREDDRCGSRW